MTLRLYALALATTLGCVVYLGAQGQDDVIRVDTRFVSVPVIVSDHNGRYVPNLRQTDFKIFQDGTEQQVAFFGATEEPVTVAILIDTSDSARGVLGDIKDSAKSFIKLLGPHDRAMVVCFDYVTHVLSPLTTDQEQLKNAISRASIPVTFGTTLRDAVYQTVNSSFSGINGRKAIIILTDGKDVDSVVQTPDLMYRLEESDTLIYTVMFKTVDRGSRRPLFLIFANPREQRRLQREREENAEAESFLQRLADVTAGRFYSSKDGKLKKTFANILEELRFQYRLGFYPPDEDTSRIHQLRVKVTTDKAVVRARGSYRSQVR